MLFRSSLIIAHHPLLFSGLKKITGSNYVERIVLKAIKHDVAIYAMHTNLDNMPLGVNYKIARRLGLEQERILDPKQGLLFKLVCYVPIAAIESVKNALFAIGAGNIGDYAECSFMCLGTGSFRPGVASQPLIGTAGGPRENVEEYRLELIIPGHLRRQALATLRQVHPYEEVAYEMLAIENEWQHLGAGMIGELKQALPLADCLKLVKETLKVACIRHTKPHKEMIQKIAVCGGSGSFLLSAAKAAGADMFITADMKYHQFFDAEDQIIIADIGHFESEQFTIEIFSEILKKKFPNFALLFTEVNTNPLNYYF